MQTGYSPAVQGTTKRWRAYWIAPGTVAVLLLAGCGAAKYAGLTATEARQRAEKAIESHFPQGTNLSYVSESHASDLKGHDAWRVYFKPQSGYGSGYSGCVVTVESSAANPPMECHTN
jgi:hypothetical protein